MQITFTPYDHDAVQAFLARVRQEFGAPGHHRRWWFASPEVIDQDGNTWPAKQANQWVLDFHFADAREATLFALKYQR